MGQDLEMLVNSRPNMSQQCALEMRSTSCTLGCINRQELQQSDYSPLFLILCTMLGILWPGFWPKRTSIGWNGCSRETHDGEGTGACGRTTHIKN